MAEVAPGIHWLKLPIPMQDSTLGHVNAYLIAGSAGYLLVDGGWNTPESFKALEEQLAEIGASIQDIDTIFCTHAHPDHYGQAGKIRELSGAKLLMHATEAGFIKPRYVDMDGLLEESARLMAQNGMPDDVLAEIRDATLGLEHYVIPAEPDVLLRGGETVSTGKFTFRVIPTPGHSAGHVCLYEADKKMLVSGDHVLPRITSNVSVHPHSGDNPLGRYLASLKELEKLDVALVLPGHESPFPRLKPRLASLARHHEARNREILAALEAGEATAYQIVGQLTWGVSSSWAEMPAFHQRLALFETLAHLELMVAEGRVSKTARGGITYYRRN